MTNAQMPTAEQWQSTLEKSAQGYDVEVLVWTYPELRWTVAHNKVNGDIVGKGTTAQQAFENCAQKGIETFPVATGLPDGQWDEVAKILNEAFSAATSIEKSAINIRILHPGSPMRYEWMKEEVGIADDETVYQLSWPQTLGRSGDHWLSAISSSLMGCLLDAKSQMTVAIAASRNA